MCRRLSQECALTLPPDRIVANEHVIPKKQMGGGEVKYKRLHSAQSDVDEALHPKTLLGERCHFGGKGVIFPTVISRIHGVCSRSDFMHTACVRAASDRPWLPESARATALPAGPAPRNWTSTHNARAGSRDTRQARVTPTSWPLPPTPVLQRWTRWTLPGRGRRYLSYQTRAIRRRRA